MSVITADEWEYALQSYPQAHILQTRQWGEVKSGFGWYPRYVLSKDCGALILFRRLPLGFSLAYIPKGPVGINWDSIWPEVDELCRSEKAILLKVEPDSWEEDEAEFAVWMKGYIADKPTIQPRRTILVDLHGSPEDWLEKMKPKHRYNTRLAAKKGVVVSQSKDIAEFHSLMKITSERNEFGVHSLAYYQRVLDQFNAGQAALFLAEYENQPLAGLIALRRGNRAWYFYGASSNLERQRMPAYLLQFEAMMWSKSNGCDAYDLWGVPDEDESRLEAEFETRNDGLWGVYRFKRGFGGVVKRSAAAWEKVYNPLLYGLYNRYQAQRGGLNG